LNETLLYVERRRTFLAARDGVGAAIDEIERLLKQG
jgi:hypothetical protein